MNEINLVKLVLIGVALAGVILGAIWLWDMIFPPPPNLLLISVDTLRADHLGCYGYGRPTSPNIDQLAQEGILFEHFISPRGLTVPALSTMLTGLELCNHRVRENFQLPEDSLNLADILGAKGYQCRGYLSNAGHMLRLGFDEASQGFTDFTNHTPRDRLITDLGVQFLIERSRLRRKPFFLWLHYMSPHRPYIPPEPWDRGLDGQNKQSAHYYDARLEDYMADRADLSDGTLDEIINYYDGCVAFVDSLIARVLATLDEQGLSRNTLVVFTADHGDELYEHHHYFLHQLSSYHGTLHVPLIIRWKNKLPQGIRVPEYIGMSNLMPTILELMRVPLKRKVDGESFWSLAETYYQEMPSAQVDSIRQEWLERPVYVEMYRLEGVTFGAYQHPYKYLFTHYEEGKDSFESQPAPQSSGRPTFLFYPEAQLFDMVEDPKQTRNLALENPDLFQRLRDEIEPQLVCNPLAETNVFDHHIELPESELEKLRALGYLTPSDIRKAR